MEEFTFLSVTFAQIVLIVTKFLNRLFGFFIYFDSCTLISVSFIIYSISLHSFEPSIFVLLKPCVNIYIIILLIILFSINKSYVNLIP